MVDYNQALSVDEALRRGRALDGEGLAWIEEPIRHDDYRGARAARARARHADPDRRELLAALRDGGGARRGRVRLVMPDLERIGGVTGGCARPRSRRRRNEMSSHLFPEVSAHLLAVTPTCHWLEYVDWAARS
jgi:mandelate racemase